MSGSPAFNILMYSHDTYGLGHIRRTMAIASHLRDENTNILILTGSPIAGRFPFPPQVDFVRIPGMIKKTNDEYRSLSIRIDDEHALGIRTNIILATAQTFKPNLFIVDKEPLGLKREVLPTLEWLSDHSPTTRSILGLRDILDEPNVVRKDWEEKQVYEHLDRLYDEIWVYGDRSIYDPVELYQFPTEVHEKVVFTGYIPRVEKCYGLREKIRKQFRVMPDDKLVLVTTGGGGDGAELLEHFISMHDYFPTSLPFKSLVITGPFMPKPKRKEFRNKAKRFGIKTLPFHPRLEELMQAADMTISMGGYNTICEILTQATPALIIPRETPRKEQLIRAQCLKQRKLIDYLPWNSVSPQLLREKIFEILSHSSDYSRTMSAFKLTGLETMHERLEFFKTEYHNGNQIGSQPELILHS
ncbi:MAG: glycosyltransferase [Desulfobulbaceae bacterium]|nr:MAG: glycosyltransferase [Desulfobulbaceae bacterium]